MRRALARVVAGAALLCAASCLNIKDVVQPGEVEAGKKFEVAVEVRAHGVSDESNAVTYAGVLAVSIPVGAEVIKASYDGAANGRLDMYVTLVPNDLPGRPGYGWVFFVTPKTYDPREYGGKDYVVTLTVRATDTPGDYRLGYAAGVVSPVGPEMDYGSVYWGMPWQGEGQEPVLERGITVK